MRAYGRIETSYWQSPKTKSLSDGARLLHLYLISCPHGNSLGCFVLPDGYIMADLRWDQKHVSKHVSELVSKRMIERCEDTFLTRIVGWFDHNTIENGKVAIGASKILKSLPRGEIFSNLIKDLVLVGNKFLNPYLNEYANTYANTVEPPEPEPEPEPEEKDNFVIPKEKPPRGTRLPEGWTPSMELFEWARAEFPHVNALLETEKFSDYWRAKTGQGATKLDWPATWRNWIRNATGKARAGPRDHGAELNAAFDHLEKTFAGTEP